MRAVRTAGNRPVLMIYDGDHLDCTELRVKQDLFFVIVDLCAQKQGRKGERAGEQGCRGERARERRA